MEKVSKTVGCLLIYIYFGGMTLSSTIFQKNLKSDLTFIVLYLYHLHLKKFKNFQGHLKLKYFPNDF